MTTRVELLRQNSVARVRFLTPNGIQILTADVRQQLSDALHQIARDSHCRVVVFEAEGRSFLAGADLNELQSLDARSAYRFAREGQRLMDQIEALPQVTLAAIHAACAGGGCELSLACDLRMGAAAARIGLPEVSLGILPGWGGTVRAVRLLGGAAARRLILTGELLPAVTARQLGLLESVTPDDQFTEAIQARIALLLSRGPEAVPRVKQLIRQFETRPAGNRFRREARRFAACYATGEPQEGIAAFLEKRPPRWGQDLASS